MINNGFVCNIDTIYFDKILSKEKKFEGRIDKGKWEKLCEGEIITFVSKDGRECKCLANEIIYYETFRQMLEDIGYKLFIPDANSLEEAIETYNNIPGYLEAQKDTNVISIE